MAKLVVSHIDFARVWYQVSYCMDVSNIARNALAMPLPPPSTDADTDGGGGGGGLRRRIGVGEIKSVE